MKLYFKEIKRPQSQIELYVVLGDTHPLMEPFKATVGVPVTNPDDDWDISVTSFGVREYWDGGPADNLIMIHHGTWNKDNIDKVKLAFKKKLKPTLERYGYLEGLSQEIIK